MGLMTSGRTVHDFKCIKQRPSGKGDASGSSRKQSVFLKPRTEKSGSLVPISPATLAPTSRRLELLVASAEAVSGGNSVGISMNVLGSATFLGYKGWSKLKDVQAWFHPAHP